jgi:hypothetical protein
VPGDDILQICLDDLQRLVLGMLAYDHAVAVPSVNLDPNRTATQTYPGLYSLVITAVIFLTGKTKTNQLRREGKAKPLVRHVLDQAPLKERLRLRAEGKTTLQEGETFEVVESDRTGFGHAIVKRHMKTAKGEHTADSQPSTPLRQLNGLLECIDVALAEVRSRRPEELTAWHEAILRHLHTPGVELRPDLFLLSDGGQDQSIQRLATMLALWFFFKKCDLDLLVKSVTCPGHSKTNPAERVCRSAKLALRGKTISPGDGTKEDLNKARDAVIELLGKHTHAGEQLRAHPLNDKGALDQYGTTEQLKAFQLARKKHAKTVDDNVGDAVLAKWKAADEHKVRVGRRRVVRQ